MNRHDMIERVGSSYLTSNIEAGEYSYVVEAGSKAKLEQCLGRAVKYQKEINTIAEAEQRLINSGYKVVKIPYFGKTGDNSACYMNGIAGTSNNKKNETYYITNSSGSKKLDNIMTEYFKKAGFDKVFFVSTTKFVQLLEGGIDCMTQEM